MALLQWLCCSLIIVIFLTELEGLEKPACSDWLDVGGMSPGGRTETEVSPEILLTVEEIVRKFDQISKHHI